MRIFDKNNTIKISADDLKDAKLSSLDFSDEQTKKRAFVNVLGARLAMKFLFSQKLEVNNLYSLYSIHKVLEKLDIADIYYENTKIDVRLVFNEDEIFIPKSHFKLGIFPDAYLILLLKQDMSGADCLGFFEPKYLDEKNANDDFYFFEGENLKDPAEFGEFLSTFVPGPKPVSTEEDFVKAENLLMSFVDDEISPNDCLFAINQLAQNISLREKFVELENFELMSEQAVKDEEIMKDNVLEIVGAQKAFNEDMNDSIEEVNFEELPDLEEMDEIQEETPDSPDDGIGKTIAQGAVIAGAAAIAGGVVATTGASIAQSMAAASAQGVAEGLISAGAAVVENIANSVESPSFEEIKEAENSMDELPEIKMEEFAPLEELPEIEETADETETIQEDLPVETKTDDSDVVDLDNFDFDMFDDDEETPESTVEDVLKEAELITGEAPIKEEPEIESEPELIEEVPESIQDEPELATEPTLEPINEAEDFNETSEPKEEKQDGIFSFDDLENSKFIPKENFAEPNDSDFELVEESNSALHSINDDYTHPAVNQDGYEVYDLSSQVEDLLKDVDLTDEQISEAAGEISFDTEDIPSMSKLSKPEYYEAPPASSSSSNEVSEHDLLSPGDNLGEEDSDLLKVLFKKDTDLQVESMDLEEVESVKMPQRQSKPSDPKRKIIAASVAGVILFSIIATGGLQPKKNKAIEFPKSTQGTTAEAPAQPTDGMSLPDGASTTDPTINMGIDPSAAPPVDSSATAQPQPDRDMGQAVSEAFMSEPVNATISKVAWEVPEEYAYNDAFRKYLQTAGKNLKLTLQNDLLLATEMAYSDKMVIDLKLNKDGSVQSENAVVSSGSKQIDKIVLQSVKETLMYLKIPAGEVSGQSVGATLIINF